MTCFFVFFASFVIYSSDFIQGEGHFISQDDDSLQFVREQLLSSAIRDVITRELSAMGLEPNHFWQQFDQSFEDYFRPEVKKLKKEFGLIVDSEDQEQQEENHYNDARELSQEELQEYNSRLRSKRLQARAHFGNLNRVIPSYTIDRMTRSSQMPNSRYLSLKARVDREILSNIYHEFTAKGEMTHFPRLYVTTEFRLSQMNWTDTGVSLERDFVEVVNEHWKRWLSDNFSNYIDQVVMTDSSTEESLSQFVRMPPEIGSSLEVSRISNADFQNSLWLKITIELSKLAEHFDTKQREFAIDGEFVLIDLSNNRPIDSFDFIREVRTFSTEDRHRLSSDLASLVYRIPVIQLDQIARSFSNVSRERQSATIRVSQLAHIGELMKISQEISRAGISSRLESHIEFYDGEQGAIGISFIGDREDLISLLNRFHQRKINDQRLIQIMDFERPFEFFIQTDNEVSSI